MPIDREATLKQADKLIKQGKLDAAIAEYVRLIDDQPQDWTTINALGDLYLRARRYRSPSALIVVQSWG